MAYDALTRPPRTTTEFNGARFQLNLSDTFTPDPGTEDIYVVPDNKFAFSPGQLSKLLNPKSLGAFYGLGGLAGFEKGLKIDRNKGLSSDETIVNGAITFKDISL